MNYILFDASRNSLLPLTYTRPVCDIRIGILTIREKWEKYLGEKTSTITEDYLSAKYPTEQSEEMMLINGSICPTPKLLKAIKGLKVGQALVCQGNVVAMYKTKAQFLSEEDSTQEIEVEYDFIKINNTWDIFVLNDKALREDFELLTQNRKSAPLSSTNRVVGEQNIFVEEGAVVEFAILNAKEGPIYIGKDAEVMEEIGRAHV